MLRHLLAPLKAFGNLPLRVTGVVVVGFPLAALLPAMTVFYLFEQQARVAEGWVEHTLQVSSGLQQILTLSIDAETAIRGYALAARPSFLEPYREAQHRLPERLGSVQALISDNPAQLARLKTVQSLSTTVLDSFEELRRQVAEGQPSLTADLLESQKSAMDRLRGELSAMQEAEQRLLVERTARQREAQQRLATGTLTGAVVGLSGGLIGALLFFTGIVRRVQRLELDAVHVAEGTPLSPEVAGRDEIATLAQALRNTAARLASQQDELRAAKQELEDRVNQRTAELQTTNEHLRQSNELSRALIEASPLAIWATDLEGRVTFWNPAAERIFGWRQDEVIGGILPIIPPDLQGEYAHWLEEFRAERSLSGIERMRLKKDGSPVEVAIWTAPLRDALGQVSGMIAIDNDVTERKRLEEQFRQSQKLEAVGHLAGGVAHDFNNLLTVIAGYVAMLLEELRNEPDLTEYATEIRQAADRASALTSQLLAFSRRQISQPRVVDLNTIVSHSLKLLSRVIGEHIQVASHLRAQIGQVNVDPTHMDQVIMNLAVNARDAMPGGGRLTIETANVTLDRDYVGKHIGVEPGAYVLLAISDTGIGMNAETRSHLFEPFYTTKSVGKGTGLGLSIVYGIVKQSGGEIMVYSEPGKGTTFKIYCPWRKSWRDNGRQNRMSHRKPAAPRQFWFAKTKPSSKS
ncbi:MAG TPA: CHASE3 domain-containing protein [Bryobacteraceae bacterium]|jgi:PAS domain S-box-containing protein|nr:CHASE3 domain-containing protein [Bryobacteraceae bacterium]